MKGGILASGVAMVVVTGGILVAGEPGGADATWSERIGSVVERVAASVGSEPPVLVLVVGSRAGVSAVRQAVASERVVTEDADAFALAEGRIVTASVESASSALSNAGWVDRELEFLSASSMGRRQFGATTGGGSSGDGDGPDIGALINKKTLTPGEAMAVLNHMDATGAI